MKVLTVAGVRLSEQGVKSWRAFKLSRSKRDRKRRRKTDRRRLKMKGVRAWIR